MITALQIIRYFESFREEAYQDSGGVWTVGYGFTSDVFPVDKDTRCKRESADMVLANLVDQKEQAVRGLATNLKPHQLVALTSLAYNIGIPKLERSMLLQCIRGGDVVHAAELWPQWDHAGGKVILGLLKRRMVEAAVFLGEDFGFAKDSCAS